MGREKRPNLVLLTRRCGGSARQMSRKRARFARPLSGHSAISAPRTTRGAPMVPVLRWPGGCGKRDRDCEVGLAVAMGDGKAERRKPGHNRTGRRRDKRGAAAADHEEPVATRIIAP